jgi:hypothetical protein
MEDVLARSDSRLGGSETGIIAAFEKYGTVAAFFVFDFASGYMRTIKSKIRLPSSAEQKRAQALNRINGDVTPMEDLFMPDLSLNSLERSVRGAGRRQMRVVMPIEVPRALD